MSYKTMLLATAAVFISTQAMAADLTGAFSVPGKGQVLSDTSISTERTKIKSHKGLYKNTGNRGYDQNYVSEVMEYGVTDQFSVNAGIRNSFDTEDEYNNDHNWGYKLGAKYNTNFDKVLFQVAGTYYTENPKDFFGHRNTDERWEKGFIGEVKLGYDLGDGLTPYLTYSFDSKLDRADREAEQSLSLGIHKYTGEYALDLAVRYDFETEGKDSEAWWLDAAADYYLKDNVALGVYGSYFLHGNGELGGEHWVDYAYEAGLRLKVMF